jgi:pyruvate dehydrogenase E2 component (dihydrolipoamide acetyltransferase)
MSESEINNDWRKVAAAIYKKPADGKIFGAADLDVTELEEYISRKRKEGLKITLTHIFTLIVARGLVEIPELNTYVRRGRIILRKQVDAMVSVLVGEGEMSSVRVDNADQLTLEQLAEILSTGIKEARKGDENKTMQMKGVIGRIPWPLRTWLFNLLKLISIKWGIPIPRAGLSDRSFGSFVMTNIGSIGLDLGFPAMFPISNVTFVFVLGGVYKKPVVVNDTIEIRRIMTISSAMDHRTVDAIHGGKLFRYIKRMIKNPEILESAPESKEGKESTDR